MASLLRSSSLSFIPSPSNSSSLLTSSFGHVENDREPYQKGILRQDGIELDETLLGISSTSIPSRVHTTLLGKVVSQVKIKSFPSSPSKARASCSIEALRAETLMIKDASNEMPKTYARKPACCLLNGLCTRLWFTLETLWPHPNYLRYVTNHKAFG